MEASTLTSKGQTTIPKRVREHLGIQPGDKLNFVVDDRGRVYLEPATLSLDDLQKILPRARKKLSIEQMDQVIRERAGR